MDCADCASVLDTHCLKLKGVLRIITSATAGKSSITFDKTIVEPEDIVKHINALTFKVKKVFNFFFSIHFLPSFIDTDE